MIDPDKDFDVFEKPNVTDFFNHDNEDDIYEQIEPEEKWSTAHKIIAGICIGAFAALVIIAILNKAGCGNG